MTTRRMTLDEIDHKLNELVERISEVEEQITRKADEVVFAQMLAHREDIEKLSQQVELLAAKLEAHNITPLPVIEEEKREEADAYAKPRRKGIFSLLKLTS